MHQSKLARDGTLLDAALERYRPLVDAPLVQPTPTEPGQRCSGSRAWAATVAAGAMQAHRKGDVVVVEATRAAPVTGAGDESYGDALSGWSPSGPGEPVRLPVVQG